MLLQLIQLNKKGLEWSTIIRYWGETETKGSSANKTLIFTVLVYWYQNQTSLRHFEGSLAAVSLNKIKNKVGATLAL